ncbi:uncharacterized protein LY79DRAFT_380075 [Colletotrichum navitas]|uniref:Uncharacterized protein n=1 Tax=Colletotrichum navitas TaxID=681940 RepID=A0AAD8QA07_9PEZI|nr:uncharacterized protein LY79DRAFT_380075 [Colletotrichum navitas]KAK1597284.1 hypothetical protein LY79DRAFT_380075 [Colletotrichum navitas]
MIEDEFQESADAGGVCLGFTWFFVCFFCSLSLVSCVRHSCRPAGFSFALLLSQWPDRTQPSGLWYPYSVLQAQTPSTSINTWVWEYPLTPLQVSKDFSVSCELFAARLISRVAVPDTCGNNKGHRPCTRRFMRMAPGLTDSCLACLATSAPRKRSSPPVFQGRRPRLRRLTSRIRSPAPGCQS